jgi:hypothetical protein
MNDLELLQRFREELAAPDHVALASAREAYRRAAISDPRKARSPRRRKPWMVPAGVAAAIILALVVPAITPLGGPGAPDPAVAGLLKRFSTIAANLPAEPAPRAGQYIYSETMMTESFVFISGSGTRFVYTAPLTSKRWLGTDGSGRIVETWGEPTFASQGDRAAYEGYVSSGGARSDKQTFDWGTTTDERYAAGELGWRDTSSLPTDPTALGRLIEDRQIVDGPDGDWESFVLAADLLRDSYARPELRAALFTYMATLPGIELVGRTTDATGRPGIALASTHDGERYEVVFDHRTAKVLEERSVALTNDNGDRVLQNGGPGEYAYASAGTTVSRTTYLVSGVVDSTTDVPPNHPSR